MSLPLNQIVSGDCLEVMKGFPEESIDCIVTDPPYGLEFMGKDWDRAVVSAEVWRECLRVLKSGAFAFVMSAPRQDVLSRMIVNLQDAGFRTDFSFIVWAFASGFPKALNISKMVDKRNGRKPEEYLNLGMYLREKRSQTSHTTTSLSKLFRDAKGYNCVSNWELALNIPTKAQWQILKRELNLGNRFDELIEREEAEREVIGTQIKARATNQNFALPTQGAETKYIEIEQTVSATPEAKVLDGCYGGFQPKPAVEIIIVAMKPLSEKTFVDQALANQKGVTWLDDCRIPFDKKTDFEPRSRDGKICVSNSESNLYGKGCGNVDAPYFTDKGRFPANLLISDDVLNDGRIIKNTYVKSTYQQNRNGEFLGDLGHSGDQGYDDSGSFSRYFDLDRWFSEKLKLLPESVRRTFPFLIVPKASKSERNQGCENLPVHVGGGMIRTENKSLKTGSGNERNNLMKNFHPTVKPLKLMSYLVTLGSREGDVVLDPFVGSGTTCLAARSLCRNSVGIEIEPEYCEIARKRLATIPERLDTLLEKKVEA